MLPRFFYYSTFSLAIVTILLRIPELKHLLIIVIGIQNVSFLKIIPFIIAVSTILDFIINKYSPIQKYREFLSERWSKIDACADKVCSNLKNHGFSEPSLNLLKPKRGLISKNNKKRVFFPLIYRQVWGFNSYEPKLKKLKLIHNQGCCGKSYENGKTNIFNIDNLEAMNTDIKSFFSFNDFQYEDTRKTRLIISIPIIKKKNTPERQKQILIGILNFESENVPLNFDSKGGELHDAVFYSLSQIVDMINQNH